MTLLAGYAQGGTDVAPQNSPPDVASKTVDQSSGVRTASGIDLNSVECAYDWAFVAKLYLDQCNPDGDAELKQDLDYTITATAEFFISNSSHPDAAKQNLETFRTQGMAALSKSIGRVCSASAQDREYGMFKVYSNALRAIPRNERRAKVKKLLAVPGPALQMCFP